MLDKKRRLFRLIEGYMNDYRGDAVREIYGEGSKIKIHTIDYINSTKSILIEVIILLGETINESVIDETLAKILLQESLVYFFPNQIIKTIIRFDV